MAPPYILKKYYFTTLMVVCFTNEGKMQQYPEGVICIQLGVTPREIGPDEFCTQGVTLGWLYIAPLGQKNHRGFAPNPTLRANPDAVCGLRPCSATGQQP
ncbi:MAG: hypothetical protein D3908_02630 [Candidatus Electrothrix sp. AUS4]|nr:hypothetical protein [Candidatus Electrothrix sp. AUS4]